MKFKLTKASNPSVPGTEKKIELHTLEALWAFVEEYGEIIVGYDYNDNPKITIYDDYVE